MVDRVTYRGFATQQAGTPSPIRAYRVSPKSRMKKAPSGREQAIELANAAHEMCPYARAIRGNAPRSCRSPDPGS
jgi:organic hydroperoxide reductase OsmC/OhrA